MSPIRTIAQTRPFVPQEVVPSVGWSGVMEIAASAGAATASSKAGTSGTMRLRRNRFPRRDRRKPDISTSPCAARRAWPAPPENAGEIYPSRVKSHNGAHRQHFRPALPRAAFRGLRDRRPRSSENIRRGIVSFTPSRVYIGAQRAAGPRGKWFFVKRLSVAATLTSVVVALCVQGTAHAAGTADLSVSLTPSSSPVTATTPLTYTISVTNKGPDVAEHTRVTDVPPTDVMILSVSGKGAYDAGTNTASWYVGPMDPGRTVTRYITIRPIHPKSDGITDTADASTSSLDQTMPNTVQNVTNVDPEPGVHYVAVRGDTGFTPSFHNVALGETVQWDVYGAETDPPHDITDSHGLGLFDSGPVMPVNYFRY